MFSQARCKSWTPLCTQQLRLRHLVRIIGYNVTIDPSDGKGIYYTLHLASMCSPFYTSEKIYSVNPKWKELVFNNVNGHNSGVVIRIWVTGNKTDSIVCVWGVYFSGLIYLGSKVQEISPNYFEKNTIIFQFIGGYFTSQICLKKNSINSLIPIMNNINIMWTNECEKIYRNISLNFSKHELRISYTIDKLQRFHNLQLRTRNKSLDNKDLREQIYVKCPMFQENTQLEVENKPIKMNVNALSMSVTSLSKFLNQQTQPTRFQRQEIWRLKKIIETAKFNCKLLSKEKDRKTADLRYLTQAYNKLNDENDYTSSLLMDRYRLLSRDLEKIRDWRRRCVDTRDAYLHSSVYLNLRRKQLISELLNIYPIEKIGEKSYTICGVYLPDSESLTDNDDTALSVGLGYVAHAVQMCSIFLHVPLRYPIHHYGSRSKIYDYITDKIPDKEREFPLYVRGKDQRYFHYAVYLLNKNIAQLRWYCGLTTFDLRTTLLNLLTLIQFRNEYEYGASNNDQDNASMNVKENRLKTDQLLKTLDNLRLQNQSDFFQPKESLTTKGQANNKRSLLGMQIANLNKVGRPSTINCDMSNSDEEESLLSSHCVDCNIEQGLDLLDPRVSNLLCNTFNEHSSLEVTESVKLPSTKKIRVARSMGSYKGGEGSTSKFDTSPSSEPNKPKICRSAEETLPNSLQEERTEFLQEWLNNGPALVCSEEHLYPDEILGTTISRDYPDENTDLTLNRFLD